MYDYFTNLYQYLENSTKKFPEKTAIIFQNRNFSYLEIENLSNKFAFYLLSKRVKRGDRVVVSLGNCIETVICFWGTLKVGAVISIVTPDIKFDKLKYILEDSLASFLICSSDQYETISNFLDNKQCLITPILNEKNDKWENVENFSTILKESVLEIALPKTIDIDLASIIYTSGSTGEPKGVMLTHRNMLAASTSINQYLKNNEKDIIISALPLSFDYGLYQLIMAISVGATLILEENFMWPAQMLKKISAHQATAVPVVPSMIPLLNQHNKIFKYNLSSVRYITNTGAALNVKHIENLKLIFKEAQIFSMYGLTECKRCTYLPPDMINKKPQSIGIAIPNTELWIVNEDGLRLGPNQLGQLVIRGATVMKGYLNKPEKTAEKLKDGLLPNEKVLYTGDYCWLDEDGYLYFHGRMDEILKSRGLKVSPKEVEDELLKNNSINEVAIVGVEEEDEGTVIYAFVVSALSNPSEKDLHSFCQKILSAEKRPKYIRFINNMPKTINGKINKLELKNRAKAISVESVN